MLNHLISTIARSLVCRAETSYDHRMDFEWKDDSTAQDDDLRPECDASVLKGGVRGKYLGRYRSGTNFALLAPEVRAAFPTDEPVNQALKSLIQGQSPS